MVFNTVTVLGTGLLGGSLAGALKQTSLCSRVVGYGRHEENLIKAREKGYIDSYELDPSKACNSADLVVFATPVERFVSLAREIRGSIQKGALVIDVGSVKGNLVHEMQALMPEGVEFVGCHPIAGGERSGIEHSDPELFKGALCIISQTENNSAETVEKVSGLWGALGCSVDFLDPEEHDRVYGLVSHFSHIIAYAIVNTAGDVDKGYLKFAGQGFMDTTRIAMSPPSLWEHIILMNAENVLSYLEKFKANVDSLYGYIRDADREALKSYFARARTLREGIEH